jgi:hypothetical protein
MNPKQGAKSLHRVTVLVKSLKKIATCAIGNKHCLLVNLTWTGYTKILYYVNVRISHFISE